jgi:hypothetical protein
LLQLTLITPTSSEALPLSATVVLVVEKLPEPVGPVIVTVGAVVSDGPEGGTGPDVPTLVPPQAASSKHMSAAIALPAIRTIRTGSPRVVSGDLAAIGAAA